VDYEGPERTGSFFYFAFISTYFKLTHEFVQLSNDPTLSSLPLLSTFLKSYSRPYLGLTPPSTKQIPTSSEPGTLSSATTNDAENGAFPSLTKEEDELVEQDVRDRFKRMCEGYFDNVAKKLVIEHKVCVF